MGNIFSTKCNKCGFPLPSSTNLIYNAKNKRCCRMHRLDNNTVCVDCNQVKRFTFGCYHDFKK